MSSIAIRDDDPPSKRALLASAVKLFVAKGVAGTTIRDVADDAGFTNPAIFKFWKNRDDLAQAVFERCYERLAEDVTLVAGAGRFDHRVRAVVAAMTGIMDADLAGFVFVTEHLRQFWPHVGQKLKRMSIVRQLADLVSIGVSEKKISADHDPALIVAAIIGLFGQFARGLYFRELAGPAAKRAPELERLITRIGS